MRVRVQVRGPEGWRDEGTEGRRDGETGPTGRVHELPLPRRQEIGVELQDAAAEGREPPHCRVLQCPVQLVKVVDVAGGEVLLVAVLVVDLEERVAGVVLVFVGDLAVEPHAVELPAQYVPDRRVPLSSAACGGEHCLLLIRLVAVRCVVVEAKHVNPTGLCMEAGEVVRGLAGVWRRRRGRESRPYVAAAPARTDP